MLGKLKTEFTSPIAKSTSPGLSDTTFFAHCIHKKMIKTQTHGCAIKRKPLQRYQMQSFHCPVGRGGGLGGKVSETRKIKERGRVSKTAAPLSSSSFLYFLNLVR